MLMILFERLKHLTTERARFWHKVSSFLVETQKFGIDGGVVAFLALVDPDVVEVGADVVVGGDHVRVEGGDGAEHAVARLAAEGVAVDLHVVA